MKSYYAAVFLSSFLITLGFPILKKYLFSLLRAIISQFNTLIDGSLEESVKQKALIHCVKKTLKCLLVFLGIFLLSVSIALIPVLLYLFIYSKPFSDLDITSLPFIISGLLGFLAVVCYYFFKKKKKKDYSDWSVLFHQLVLNNYNLSKLFFKLEKRLFKSKIKNIEKEFVIVTGLARAGTTALTKLLYDSGKFHSLSYSTMPLLLSPNSWRKIYSPKKEKLKERTHGDKVLHGYQSIEALEEYFFKVYTKDAFILENQLIEHTIDEQTYKEYLNYQHLINVEDKDSIYLAKNNNFILRYQSLRAFNEHFKVILLFRNPIEHANSLVHQHLRFSTLQKEDPFTLEYMNWLAHHEFGLNHKAFSFQDVPISTTFEADSINYWLELWINYYEKVLSIIGSDNNIMLLDYTDFLNDPEAVILSVEKFLGYKLDLTPEKFSNPSLIEGHVNTNLVAEAKKIHAKLITYKLEVT